MEGNEPPSPQSIRPVGFGSYGLNHALSMLAEVKGDVEKTGRREEDVA